MDPYTVALALAVGLAAGAAGTFLGIGGGAIMVPVLTAAGVPVKVAAPASLVAILGTSAGGLRRLLRRGLVRWRLAVFLESASALGAAAGVHLQGVLSERQLRLLLGLVLLASSAGVLLQDRLGRPEWRGPGSWRRAGPLRLAAAWLASLAAGTVSALLGVGGGVLKVPVMALLLGLPMKLAVSTSKLMVGMTAAVGVAGYTLEGRVEWGLALPLLLGTYTGATLAARRLVAAREAHLRLLAASYYALTGLLLAARSL